MKHTLSLLSRRVGISLLALLALCVGTLAQAEDGADSSGGRAVALQIEAVVTDIDLETRQVSLQAPDGEIVTVTAQEQVVKLEDVSVGDRLVVTYLAALEGEVREPTEEELAEPWVVLEEAGEMGEDGEAAIGAARMIRAVCTIEGMNRVLGTVTIRDARGRLHVIGDVEPEKMEGVTLGQTVVVVYAEALALSLEHHSAE